MNALLDAALAYGQKGLPVFPCDPATKRPYTGHGFKNASADEATIRAWWARHPDAMIAIPTGTACRAWVLDIDNPALFEASCKITLPATRRSDTGKGYHLWFKFDPEKEVRNSQLKQKDGKSEWPFPTLPGAEVRGEGGYVIVPPSVHPNGRAYEWTCDETIAEPPADLLRIVRKVDPASQSRQANGASTASSAATGEDTPWGLAALDGECASIRNAGNGAQEGTLNDAALKIGAIVAGKQLSLNTARARLFSAALEMPSYDSKRPWTPEAITKKIERGLTDGARQPRYPEERGRMRFGPAPSDTGPEYDPDTGELHDEHAEPRAEQAQGSAIPDLDPEPVDLWARYDAPEFPTGLLPKVIENLAIVHGDIMGVAPAGLAMGALTVCAAAITDDIALQVKKFDPTWTESARLWVGLVGLSSRKKSPIMSVIKAPLMRINKALMITYEQQMADYMALPTSERHSSPKPKMLRRVASDATIESLQMALKDSTWGLLSEQDELSGWFGAMDKYTPGKGSQADRAFWLKAYNGGGYIVDRVARGSSMIPNLSVSLIGGIQPEPIRKVANESVDDGLIQRIIPVLLAPARVGKDQPAGEVVKAYNEVIEYLVRLKPPPRNGIPSLDQAGRPQPLHFTDEARAVRERLEEEHHELVESLEPVSPKLSAHYGKYDGMFARMCVIWHCLEHCATRRDTDFVASEITGETAERVAGFMSKFVRPSAVAFYAGMLGLSDGHDTLMNLASYIVAKELTEINARVIQKASRSLQSYSADEARLLCERLENFGWLTPMDPKTRSNTPRWGVNPRVHEMFAQKGREETERRKKAISALKAALKG